MLLMTQATNCVATKKYFETVLTQGDYYLGQEVAGHWWGLGADLLGVGQGARVENEPFARLLQGFHPVTGAKLTQRLRKDRRPGMDLTFSVPKSVSLAWALGSDERVVAALQEAVRETMTRDVEPLVARRRREGVFAATKQQRPTGKLIYADFLHKTSRPVDGHPDPHLHVHAFVMNWTEEGGRHFAGELEEIKRQAPTLQAKFEARLAGKLERLGYRVEPVRYQQSGRHKRGWEITGVERATIEKFSRRTDQIEAHALVHGIDDAAVKGKLGVLTRQKKEPEQSVSDLRALWFERLSDTERIAFASLLGRASGREEGTQSPAVAAAIDRPTVRQAEQAVAHAGATPRDDQRALESVHYALDHHLYRQSTVERHRVVATALEHALTLSPESIEHALDRVGVLQAQSETDGRVRQLVTTRSVLEAERRMIAYARDGRGTRRAIGSEDYAFRRDWLNGHQKGAVRHVLTSRDAVTAVVGGAGTGKTSLMEEAADAVRASGKEVFTFAPSTGAREVLQEKGFENAQTVEHLIRNTRLQESLRDQVLWVDEAGLLDVRSMNAVFAIAQQQNARVVLSGDTRQHASPGRGEAMRLLETEAGLNVARSEEIQRQKGRYRRAIELVSRGEEVVDRQGTTGLAAGFDLLDALGKIHELPADQRCARLAERYLAATEQGKSSLVVAPTHAEGRAVTAEIRDRLRAQGRLSLQEQTLTQLRSLNLSAAQKSDPRNYAADAGLVVQFHQNTAGGFERGDRYRVTRSTREEVLLTPLTGGDAKPLPREQADRFEVYTEHPLTIAVGDKVRFSLGGVTANQAHRISNGRLDEVKGFDKRGNLLLKNGWKVRHDYGHLDLGYVITSHAAQGKDSDVAIAAMGAESLPAVNARQFYVTASRGRDDIAIYVDDKQRVRAAIQQSGRELSASELARSAGAIGEGAAKAREAGGELKRRALAYRDRVVQWWRGRQAERGTEPTPEPTRFLGPQPLIDQRTGVVMTPQLEGGRG